MRCTDCREALSAQLDGEDLPGERAALDEHLDSCAECRRYADRAAQVTRLARTGLVEPVPDLLDAVLATAPAPRRVRWETALRALLAAIGVGQLGLAVNGVLAATHSAHQASGPGGADLAGATLAHFSHESSAWNLALAVGFLWVAARTGRSAALVPVVGAFVGMLAGLSVLDIANDRVDPSRLLSHGVVVLGLLVLIVLGRLGGHPVDGMPGARASGASRRPDPSGELEPERRSEPPDDGHGLKPTARHRAA